jgi:hypothetical protein
MSKILTENDVRDRLAEAVKKAGGIRPFSRLHEISPTMISQVIQGLWKPTANVAGLIGIEKVTVWREASQSKSSKQG